MNNPRIQVPTSSHPHPHPQVSNDQTRRDRAGEEILKVKMITCNKDARVRESKLVTQDYPLRKGDDKL